MSNLGNKKIMADNILYYMNLHGKTRNDLCIDLGFKYTTVTGWLTAEKYPRIDKIEMMADYFGVTKANLVEERRSMEGNLSPKKKELLSMYDSLEEEGQKLLLATARTFVAEKSSDKKSQ